MIVPVATDRITGLLVSSVFVKFGNVPAGASPGFNIAIVSVTNRPNPGCPVAVSNWTAVAGDWTAMDPVALIYPVSVRLTSLSVPKFVSNCGKEICWVEPFQSVAP